MPNLSEKLSNIAAELRKSDMAFPTKLSNMIVKTLIEIGADNKGGKPAQHIPNPGAIASKMISAVEEKLAGIYGQQNVVIELYGVEYTMTLAQGEDHDEKEYGFEIRIPGFKPYYVVLGFKYLKGDFARIGFSIGSGKFQIAKGHRNVF